MNVILRTALLLSALLVSSYGFSDPLKEVAREIGEKGWFSSCGQALPRLAKIEEPSRGSAAWKAYLKLKAGCLSEVRRDAEAIAYLESKFPEGVIDPELLEYVGTSHVRLGNHRQAVKYLKASLASERRSDRLASIRSKLALSYAQLSVEASEPALRLQLLKKAEKSVREAIELLHSPTPNLYVQLGQIQMMQGNLALAEQSLDEAMIRNETYDWDKPALRKVMAAEALRAKSDIRRLLGDSTGARKLAKEAVDTAPTESLKIVLKALELRSTKAIDSGNKSGIQENDVLSPVYVPLDEEL